MVILEPASKYFQAYLISELLKTAHFTCFYSFSVISESVISYQNLDIQYIQGQQIYRHWFSLIRILIKLTTYKYNGKVYLSF
jgi:hypothetical protein